MIEVPDIRQNGDYDCGDAAIDAALGAIGAKRPRGTRLANPVQGMGADTVAAILRGCGLKVWAGPVLTGIEGLRHLTRAGLPVLCCISERGGHWVVVRGVSRGRVYFQDPAAGPTSRPVGAWLGVWHDSEAESGHHYDRWGIAVAR